jgi:hypothetical protein
MKLLDRDCFVLTTAQVVLRNAYSLSIGEGTWQYTHNHQTSFAVQYKILLLKRLHIINGHVCRRIVGNVIPMELCLWLQIGCLHFGFCEHISYLACNFITLLHKEQYVTKCIYHRQAVHVTYDTHVYTK